MRPLHTKRKRSTRKDAHQFRQTGVGGGMASDDYLSDTDRQKIGNDVETQLKNVVATHFPRTQNLEYAILKAHLIIEHAITEFIRCTSYVLVNPEQFRFTFSQKLEIAILNGLGIDCPTTIPSIEILNQIRNQVAHRFSFDRHLLNELIQINTEDINPTTLTDRQCIACLRSFCAFLCGCIAGQIEFSIIITSKKT